MRTGANFARGSCRALKWMLVLGALSVLGSAQALAQATAVEEARYPSTTSRNINVTMTEDVWLNLDAGENRQELAGDFALIGGTTGATAAADADAVHPIAVDGIPLVRYPGATGFTLRFDQVVSGLADPDDPLQLVYSPTDARDISGTDDGAALTTFTVPVIGPEETSDLQLTFTGTTGTAKSMIEVPKKRGAVLMMDPDPAKPLLELPFIVLPEATPIGGTFTYSVDNLPPGLLSTTSASDTPPTDTGLTANANARATIYGTLPNYIGTWDVRYSVTDGTDTESVAFKINVADTPEPPVFPVDPTAFVTTAGPSSLKVTWRPPNDNNARIIRYEVEYKSAGTDGWLEALIPDAVANALATSRTPSYTITGLAPGGYDVRVSAWNVIGQSAWTEGSGETGAAPGTPTLTLTMDSELDEERNQIPVTVTAKVPPSAQTTRELKVTLWIAALPGTLAEDAAELPNTAGIDSDVAWASDSPGVPLPRSVDPNGRGRVLTLGFNSNLSSEAMAYLNTAGDADAENETFRIRARAVTTAGDDFATSGWANHTVVIDDDEVQEYKLQLDDVALESSGMFDEGNGDEPVTMKLIVSPARTLPKSFFVSLESAQDARDYSLTSGGTSSGGPTAVSLRIDMPAGKDEEGITLTAASNDGDRMDDTITLRMFETSAASPTTAGDPVGDAVMLTVVDQHKLPTVTMGPIMVDGAAVNSLKEGETGTVTLMADRGTATDDVPDGEKITVALTHGAASSASAADYSLSSEMVTISGTSGTFMLEVLEDDQIDAEELVLQAAVTGVAMYGDAADMVDLGPISLMDGTTKLVYPKTDEEIQAVIYPAKDAGMGADKMFNPGETIEIASPGSLFNTAEGVTLSFTAESDMDDVATVAVSGGGMVTVTAQDMAGVMAHITITAHASMAATAAKGLPQTDPSEASIIFPVEVGLEALSFTLTGPEDMMNLTEGMSAMVTATANRAVTADVTINLMRDRAASTAGDDDYMAEAITIEAGMMSGTTMVMAVDDNMAEEMEELVLYGMAADNAGEVMGEVKLSLWDAAVPALPLIAQLLLGLFLAIGGFRRYLRR